MPVSNVAPIIDYTANGVTVAFAYPFKTFFASDLQVYVNSVLQVGGYSVSGLGLDTGGTVTFSTAPANGAAVQIVRQLPFSRTTDYQPAGAFREDQVDRDQDIQTMQIQQLARDIGGYGNDGSRVMRLVDGDPSTNGRFDARQNRIINALDPVDPADVVTLQAMQTAIASATLNGVGIKSLPSYAAIALYTGGDNILYLEGRENDKDGGEGFIYLDETDTTSLANDGTIWIDELNRRWKRQGVTVIYAAWFGAKFDSVDGLTGTDNTAIINKCNSFGLPVILPKGCGMIDPDVGVKLKAGATMLGAGLHHTILAAYPKGATVPQLASYTKGSIIKRDNFNPTGTNQYVNNVYLADFSVLLNHPTTSITNTQVQIGLDFRNMTNAIAERTQSGNIPPVGGIITKSAAKPFLVQGYGVVFGTLGSSDPAYCGGEKNKLINSLVFGAYKTIAIDEATLSPNSAAHWTEVIGNDVQTAHHLIVQESRFTTGCVVKANCQQDIVKQSGDASNSFVSRFEGYGNAYESGYIEAGTNVDYMFYLGAQSKGNYAKINYASATGGAAAITDAGAQNKVEYRKDTGANPSGKDYGGKPLTLVNNLFVPDVYWCRFRWNGTAIVIDGQSGGFSITRTAAGDYTVTIAPAFADANYSIGVSMEANVSGHAGTYAFKSQTANSFRLFTYAQQAGSTVQLDPIQVTVTLAK